MSIKEINAFDFQRHIEAGRFEEAKKMIETSSIKEKLVALGTMIAQREADYNRVQKYPRKVFHALKFIHEINPEDKKFKAGLDKYCHEQSKMELDKGLYETGADYLQFLLDTGDKSVKVLLSSVYNKLAIVHFELGEYITAHNYFVKSIETVQDMDKKVIFAHMALCLHMQAKYHAMLKEYHIAAPLFQRAVTLQNYK